MKLMSVSALSAVLMLAGCQSTTTPSSAVVQPKASAQATRDAVLASGVDVINAIAVGIAGMLVRGVFSDPEQAGDPQTRVLAESARIPGFHAATSA